MTTFFLKRAALMATLAVGLLWGATARCAELGQQTEPVVYTLELDDGAGGVVSESSTKVRVVVKVSIPRTEAAGETAVYKVPLSAKPVRIMARAHKGPATAFDGSLRLTKLAGTANEFYPMPQSGTNTTLIPSGTVVPAYAMPGKPHDLARWEAIYTTEAFTITNGTTDNAMIDSLLANEATYEWYVASQYAIGAIRISDIQDHGRKMSFREKRMWMPSGDGDTMNGGRLGTTFAWKLRSMPLDANGGGWTVRWGTIDYSDEGDAGALLLNPTDSANPPRIESPYYEDGISKITFWAKTSYATPGEPQKLVVQVPDGTGKWVNVEFEDELTLSTTLKSFTVDFAEALNADDPATPDFDERDLVAKADRFRIVRSTVFSAVGEASLLAVTVRDVLVSSALPTMDVEAPKVTVKGESKYYPYSKPTKTVNVAFGILPGASAPNAYEGTLKVRRKAKGDAETWYETEKLSLRQTAKSMDFSFTPGALTSDTDGNPNVTDGAFFIDAETGHVTGMLPGVYDMMLDYKAMGSFKAGRELIEEREYISGSTDCVVNVEPDGTELKTPYALDLREQETAQQEVYLEVTYRSGMGVTGNPYVAKTLPAVPLLPSPKEPNKWRVDLAKVLHLEQDDSAEYAWCYDPTPNDPDKEDDLLYETERLCFYLCVRDFETGAVTKYGMDSALTPDQMPTPYVIVPAITETLKLDSGVPMVIDLSEENFNTSHVMLEVDLTPDQEGKVVPELQMGGSYWQDFNTWYSPSSNFTTTEFREDVNNAVADFNYDRKKDDDDSWTGWVPDEGPWSTTTTISDSFHVGLDDNQTASLHLPVETSILTAWGAGSTLSSPSLYGAPMSGQSYFTEQIDLGGNTELVLARKPYQASPYLPDALLRLRGGSQITPRTDTAMTMTLNGVGTVSFKLSLSLPYDISRIVRIVGAEDTDALRGYGLSTKVEVANSTCAPSGYSVSLYLDDWLSNTKYEFRVTEVRKYGRKTSEVATEPKTYCYYEIYKWTGETAKPVAITQRSETYNFSENSLSGMTLAFWMDADGALYGAAGAGTMQTRCTTNAGAASTTKPYYLAFGSAECRPTLRSIQRLASASETYTGVAKNILSTDAAAFQSGDTWAMTQDDQTTGTIMLRRRAPNGNLEGKVVIEAGDALNYVSTSEMNVACSIPVGKANATLKINPVTGSNVFIDDLVITSWCGNDKNRNGDSQVPTYTDEGFTGTENYGFSGVGIWIRPTSDAELTTTKAAYSGEQCALLQLSRRNMSMGGGALAETDGITHTGQTLALYSPFSETGFGAQNFRYMVPADAPDVYVMLQYNDSPTPSNDHLSTNAANTNWVNVSDPVLLENTNGQWLSASITPRKKVAEGKYAELVGDDNQGTLRLVLVTKTTSYNVGTTDPMVYIDDWTVTDNSEEVAASWTATNVKLTDLPINQLYWKDRVAVDEAGYKTEETFAEKRGLTQAMQLNNAAEGPGIELINGVPYRLSELTSPKLRKADDDDDGGAGRVTFAARLAGTAPTRLYLYATEEDDPAEGDWNPVTYVDVKSTVYESFDIDLSKITNYLAPSGTTGNPFASHKVTYLQFRTLLPTDTDPVTGGTVASAGRVLIDQVAITNPVRPSIRVKEVAFANVAQDTVEDFDHDSPLSQPVGGGAATMMSAMVTLDRAQLLDTSTIRVFLTFNPDSQIKSYTGTTGNEYTYTDVLGEIVAAAETSPIYAWNTASLGSWALKSWFDPDEKLSDTINANKTLFEPNATEGAALALIKNLGGVYANTVELTKSGADLNYVNDALHELELKTGSVSTLTALPVNTVVRYTAWAVYKDAEADNWFITTLKANDYTEYPWYFPRSLNKEILSKAQDTAQEAEDKAAAAEGREPQTILFDAEDYFSPYYWVYSCSPGEVFINEINLNESTDKEPPLGKFVEVCAPTGINLTGWRVGHTTSTSTFVTTEATIWPETGTELTLPEPATGAVPMKREGKSSAKRSFYTFFGETGALFYKDAAGTKFTGGDVLATTANAGAATSGFNAPIGGSSYASSVLLYRPTGGAEHIVVYKRGTSGDEEDLDLLYNVYKNAYVTEGFSSEWYQDFVEEGWEILKGAQPSEDDPLQKVADARGMDATKLFGRRLAKVDTFPADASADNRYTPASTNTAPARDVASGTNAKGVVNSLATVDMGGFWVTRKNAVKGDDNDIDNGPADLTELMTDGWDAANRNPVEDPRPPLKPGDAYADPAEGAKEPYVQVTPRQINPDQYLFPYTGFSQSIVVSTLNPALGTHSLTLFNNDAGQTEGATRRAGQETPKQWSVGVDVPKVRLTYEALPFHQTTKVMLRIANMKDPTTWLSAEEVNKLVEESATLYTFVPDEDPLLAAEGWVSETVNRSSVALTVALGKTGEEVRYNFDAQAFFEQVPDAAKDIITKVAACTGDTNGEPIYDDEGNLIGRSPTNQPWWGSNFGFDVTYDTTKLPANTSLTSVIVTYPNRDALWKYDAAGTCLAWDPEFDAVWTGKTLSYVDSGASTTGSLEGMEYNTAIRILSKELLGESRNIQYVEIRSDGKGTARDPSVMPIFGDSYYSKIPLDHDESEGEVIEPAIPFCVWGVYTVVIPTDDGTIRYSFLMRQAELDPENRPNLFTPAAHTAPVNEDKKLPYFYLYSTPPRSAWLSELNLDADNPYAEVVMPFLRDGILNADVPQTDPNGWTVACIEADANAQETTVADLKGADLSDSWSSSYKYCVKTLTQAETKETAAYVLKRPCGAAEGGVWTGVGTGEVTVPAEFKADHWVRNPEVYVVPGVRDAAGGSVQLVGETETITVGSDNRPIDVISSYIEKRNQWAFLAETPGEDNNNGKQDLPPDPFPWWNQVAITSTLRNTTYPGTFCGYQMVPGTFEDLTPPDIRLEPLTATFAGTDWTWKANAPKDSKVLSYRPRANYHIQQIKVPQELIGKIMLVGNDQVLPITATATQSISVQSKVQELLTNAPADESENPPSTAHQFTDWLAVAKNGTDVLARAESRIVPDKKEGKPIEEYTGVITFNPDFVMVDGEEPVTFADLNYVISIVFIDEPPAAANAIEVAMSQGEVKTGAWLATQTLYAVAQTDPVAPATGPLIGEPIPEKGGEAVAKPIWSDEGGNADGEHKNVHGWLYQPIVGDHVGMAAVINPELGLLGGNFAGGTIETISTAFKNATVEEGGSIRPVLLWSLIPKIKVPSNLMDENGSGTTYDAFMDAWDLTQWAGVNGILPSVADGLTTNFTRLRTTLHTANTGDTAFAVRAGMVPMVYFKPPEPKDTEAAEESEASSTKEPSNLFAFRTMTKAEFDKAVDIGLLPQPAKDDPTTTDIDETENFLPFDWKIDMSDKTVWQDGAILRFAIALVDTSTDTVYECQSIANFSSDDSDIYCPWYLPDAQTNVNYRTLQKSKGISPYMWVYTIPRDGVWLNEIRPFGGNRDVEEPASAAIELAMYPSPLTETTTTTTWIDGNGDEQTLTKTSSTPDYSLDGWKIVTKVAPMPAENAELEVAIEWKTCREIPLYSWIPYTRIVTTPATDPLDFYVMTTKITQNGFSFKEPASVPSYDPLTSVGLDTFQWLKLTQPDGLQPYEVFFSDADIEGFSSEGGEILYSISLVRSNGVVEDEILFFKDTTQGDWAPTQARAQRAVDIMTATNQVAGAVRYVRSPIVPAVATTQFLVREDYPTEGEDFYFWYSTEDNDGLTNTMPSKNRLDEYIYKQPYRPQNVQLSTLSTLTAQVVGGNGLLSLSRANVPQQVATSVSAVYANGSTYSLGLFGVNSDWYRLHGITKNGQAFTPETQANTVYTLSGTTVTTSEELTIAQDALLNEDTQYIITFVYTPEAATLVQRGDLNSEDDGFLAWLLKKDPTAIIAQTNADGVTASEKYWLGLDNAAISAEDVALNFTQIGFHQEPDVNGVTPEAYPMVSVALTNDGKAIDEINGDGALVLLGKETLDGEWQFIKRLHAGDINGDTELILNTSCKFFRAILLSTKQATDLEQ